MSTSRVTPSDTWTVTVWEPTSSFPGVPLISPVELLILKNAGAVVKE